MLAFNIRLKNMQSYYRICSICFLHMTRSFILVFFSELLTAKSKTSTKDRQYKLLAGELKYNTIFLLFYSTRLLQRFFLTAKVLLPMHQLFTGRSWFRFICQELVISIIHARHSWQTIFGFLGYISTLLVRLSADRCNFLNS